MLMLMLIAGQQVQLRVKKTNRINKILIFNFKEHILID
ncbi:hypothetical protein DESAMIL20_689 [Desulfurella amilsii]|uniref:Uncharacterized protein n=1 Tax=Desulfurella amilsii TaxID=1562698 RepID=A0A1X4XYA4_9BACT|nr:hypothetical protein DESAMIL20_689 [Desulfurella amilsii]